MERDRATDSAGPRLIVRALAFAYASVWRSTPGAFCATVLLTCLMGVTPSLTVYAGRLVLDGAAAVLAGGTAAAWGQLGWGLGVQLGVLASSTLFMQMSGLLQFWTSNRMGLDLQADFLRRASKLDYSYYEDAKFFDMISRARRESTSRPTMLVRQSTGLASRLITFGSMAAIVGWFDLPLLAGMVLLCLPLLAVQMRYGSRAYNLEFERTDARRMSGYLFDAMTRREYVPEISSYGLFDNLYGRWREVSARFLDQDFHLRRRRTAAETLSITLLTVGTVGVTAYVLWLSLRHGRPLTIGQVMMYVGAFTGGLMAWRGALEELSGIYENSLFLHDLVAFRQLRPRMAAPPTARPIPPRIESIEFRGVSYRYPGTDRDVLKGIDLEFRRSRSTLLVGPNGAGKTTIVKLMMRLYDPTRGSILVNGVDAREFDPVELRRAVGVVFQNFLMLPLTARENIGCGDVERMDDMERVRRAGERSGAHAIVAGLPRQYETVLSRMFADGLELSLGQWQRICLARLFMKDAPVCVLDEPTASMDIEAEAALLREINRMALDNICVLISHRAIRPGIADRIVVMSEGRIVESGDYDSLIAHGGEFARLAKLYYDHAAGR